MNSVGPGDPGSDEDGLLELSIKRALVLQCMVAAMLLTVIIVFNELSAVFSTDATGFNGGLADKLKASAYGSMLAIAGTMLSARSVRRSTRRYGEAIAENGFSAMVPIYSGLLNKLVIVGGGIAFGLIALGLQPVFVVTGYFIVQIATVIPGVWKKS